jgi:hypothetical protein
MNEDREISIDWDSWNRHEGRFGRHWDRIGVRL